jgi:hypothetical protein
MTNNLSLFDHKKIERLAKQASEKGIANATAYLWKVAKNSVKKGSGREKKYSTDMLAWDNSKREWKKVDTVKSYLSSPNRENEQVVQRDTMRDVRDPKTEGSYLQKSPSSAGQPPHSHKTLTPGWRDFWLKKGIRFDPKAGTVFLNPAHIEKGYSQTSKKMPLLIEEGGDAIAHIKRLMGYAINKRYFKNGKTTVSYSPIYSRKIKRYRMQERPFLKPALHKAAEKLLKILEGSIGK